MVISMQKWNLSGFPHSHLKQKYKTAYEAMRVLQNKEYIYNKMSGKERNLNKF